METFARALVKITLSVEPKAIEWIAKNSKNFRFLVGNSKDYQVTYKTNVQAMSFHNFFLFKEFFLDKSETEFTVVKKSWWKLPTQAKVAVGHRAGQGYLASQFVVNHEDVLEIRLEDHELKVWVNKEKKSGREQKICS